MQVACTWNGYKIVNTTCYVLTVPGLLKVLETFMAGVIFAFLSNTSLPWSGAWPCTPSASPWQQ